MTLGICGGYQMLGKKLHDPLHTESVLGSIDGLGLLDMEVMFHEEKRTVQSVGTVCAECGWLAAAKDMLLDGYEIHAGDSTFGPDTMPWLTIGGQVDGVSSIAGNVMGTYLHGLFDDGQLPRLMINHLKELRGQTGDDRPVMTLEQFREREFDRLADVVRSSVDMDMVYRIIRGEV